MRIEKPYTDPRVGLAAKKGLWVEAEGVLGKHGRKKNGFGFTVLIENVVNPKTGELYAGHLWISRPEGFLSPPGTIVRIKGKVKKYRKKLEGIHEKGKFMEGSASEFEQYSINNVRIMQIDEGRGFVPFSPSFLPEDGPIGVLSLSGKCLCPTSPTTAYALIITGKADVYSKDDTVVKCIKLHHEQNPEQGNPSEDGIIREGLVACFG